MPILPRTVVIEALADSIARDPADEPARFKLASLLKAADFPHHAAAIAGPDGLRIGTLAARHRVGLLPLLEIWAGPVPAEAVTAEHLTAAVAVNAENSGLADALVATNARLLDVSHAFNAMLTSLKDLGEKIVVLTEAVHDAGAPARVVDAVGPVAESLSTTLVAGPHVARAINLACLAICPDRPGAAEFRELIEENEQMGGIEPSEE